MTVYSVKGDDELPEVLLDRENGIFKFAGKSLPEDVVEFYTPVIQWIRDYANNPNDNTTVEFRMEYFNTASSKRILDILEEFNEIKENGKSVLVKWFFRENDEDMEEAGESFFEIVDIDNELIEYSI